MNSKIFILFLFLAVGCGVKGDPLSPKTPRLPSLMENYPDIQTETPVQDHQKIK